MKPTYTNHARRRMKQRRVSESEVEMCLEDHDLLWTDRNGNPKYSKYIDGRLIKVVVKKDNPDRVITVED